MSYPKSPEELLAVARALPPELSYDEVSHLFLNPTPPPPAPAWWRRYLPFLVMTALLISLLTLLLASGSSAATPALSAFPVPEMTPGLNAVTPLPPTRAQALRVPRMNVPTPRPSTPAPLTAVAPATAPESMVVAESPTETTAATVITSGPPARRGNMPSGLFEGSFMMTKDALLLTFKEQPEAEEDRLNLLVLDLTDNERKLLKKTAASNLTLTRAAGSLILYRDKKGGSFEFLLDDDYRDRYTERGWAPEGITNGDGFFHVTMGKAKEDFEAQRVSDQLWFRYFATDIDDDYLTMLRGFGYVDADFSELWRIANTGKSRDDLKALLQLVQKTISGKVSIEELLDISDDTEQLEQLRRSGDRMSVSEFQAAKATPSIWERLAKLQNPEATKPLVDSLKRAHKEARARYFSLEIPGTAKETIDYVSGKQLTLIGNFELKLDPDLANDRVIVYGPEKRIKKMRRKSDYAALRLINKSRKQPLYISVPPGANLFNKPKKGVTIEYKIDKDMKKN